MRNIGLLGLLIFLVQLGDNNQVSDFFSSFILISAFRNKQ